jgi:hypothetical protein
MVSHLIWVAAGIIGVGAAALTLRRIRRQGARREPDGKLARAVLPRLPISPADWDRIAVARGLARYWTRQAATVVVGVFCVLVTLGALLEIVIGQA